MTHHRNMSMLLAAACLLALAVPAQADATRTHSFEGSCAIVGYAELKDRMTPVPTQSWFWYRGEGRCMGTLDGEVLPERGLPVRMTSEGPRAVHSCAVGYDPGSTWRITFDLPRPERDLTIHGYGDIVDVLRSQNSVFHGQRDGTAVAVNTIQGHAETLQQCFSEGVTAGSVGIQVDTLTPLVSDDRFERPASAETHPTSQRPRLSVRPRRLRAGRRTRLRFHATVLRGGRRSPLRGATIRFAGRRARTDRRGRASLVVRPRRTGRHRILMRAPDGTSVARTIRVIRRGRR